MPEKSTCRCMFKGTCKCSVAEVHSIANLEFSSGFEIHVTVML